MTPARRYAHAQLKTYGYGKPVLIHYRVGDQERRSVLRTMAPNAFGHERRADRAAGLLLSYDTFNDLERHVRALDLGVLRADGQLASLDPGEEFFLLTDYATGVLYAEDLKRSVQDRPCDGSRRSPRRGAGDATWPRSMRSSAMIPCSTGAPRAISWAAARGLWG